jgi:hypothetical protein
MVPSHVIQQKFWSLILKFKNTFKNNFVFFFNFLNLTAGTLSVNFLFQNEIYSEAAAGPKMGFGDPRHDRQLSERMFFIEEWKQASLVLDRFVQQFFLKIRLLKKMLVQLKGCSFSCFCYQCR